MSDHPEFSAALRSGTDCSRVVSEIASGRSALILDGPRGAVLFFAAVVASTASVDFAVRYSSGLIHAAMSSDRLDALRIGDQPVLASEGGGHGFTVAVDAKGVGTGISAQDRALTLRVLGSPDTKADDLRRPGHILPIRCRTDHTDGQNRVWTTAMKIVEKAGFSPVAGICRLVHDTGDVLDDDAAVEFAEAFALPVVSYNGN